jgi:hypothetical protein
VLLTDGVVEFYSRSNFCPALLSVVERQVLASPATAEDLSILLYVFWDSVVWCVCVGNTMSSWRPDLFSII